MGYETCEIETRRGLFLGLLQRWRFVAVTPARTVIATSENVTSALLVPRPGWREHRAVDRLLSQMATDGWMVQPRPAHLKREDWWRIALVRRVPDHPVSLTASTAAPR